MAILHAAPGELIDIHPFEDFLPKRRRQPWSEQSTWSSFALVLPVGMMLPQRQAASVITVQCIEGAVEFKAMDIATHAPQYEAVSRPGERHSARSTRGLLLFWSLC